VGKGDFMKDMQTHLEMLRKEAAECLVLSNLATDPEKRQVFARLAEHITGLASAVQNEVALQPANVARAAETAVVDHKQATRSRQMLPWFVVVMLLAAAGAFVWPRAEKAAFSVTALEEKAEPPAAPQEDTKQAIAKFVSAEDEKRKVLLEQQGALAARVAKFMSAEDEKRKVLSEQLGALAARVDNLEKARAEIAEPTTKRDAETIGQSRHRKHRSAIINGAARSTEPMPAVTVP
jgi:hypothetical protein